MNRVTENNKMFHKLRFLLSGHRGTILKAAWSSDGTILASCSTDKILRLWDARRGTQMHAFNMEKPIHGIVWSPDSKMFAAYSTAKMILVWDMKRLGKTALHHEGAISKVVWSPDNASLASCSSDKTIRIWNPRLGNLIRELRGHQGFVYDIAWSSDDTILASCSVDKKIILWDIKSGIQKHTLIGHTNAVTQIAWSPDGRLLASASDDKTIRIWDASTGVLHHTLSGHKGSITKVIWSPDGATLTTSSYDRTIRVWNAQIGIPLGILEAHTDPVRDLSFSADGQILASISFSKENHAAHTGKLCLWSTDQLKLICTIDDLSHVPLASFHPEMPILVSAAQKETELMIQVLDMSYLVNKHSSETLHYTNAKVVLMGDTGVGKSGLGLVLTGSSFTPTESTHARRIWTLKTHTFTNEYGQKETREVLLWDLAGQPGYRLIHQLHLDEIAVAVVVFDARSETDPFAGVKHWKHALDNAQIAQGNGTLPVKKLLVAARIDREGVGVSAERLQAIQQELGFDGYINTSAKEGYNIDTLKTTILQSINWQQLPIVSSTRLFQQIKMFLIEQKAAGRILATTDDLYHQFRLKKDTEQAENDLRAQVETCIGRLEAVGLLKRLSFGKLVLLQPEMLDVYASALVNAVKDEPDGLGSINEHIVRTGGFRIPLDERLKDREQEKLLLIAMTEDLIRRELVLREGDMLVFPSQSTREYPQLPEAEGKAIVFSFRGAVLNIYATLAVRLANSGFFGKKELWQNAIAYQARVGGTCGIFLQNSGEGQARLTIFFDQHVSEEIRSIFEEYVYAHLQRQASPQTVQRHRLFTCSDCGTTFSEQMIQKRRARGFDWMICNVCDTRVSLKDREQKSSTQQLADIRVIDDSADRQRERSAAASVLQGKVATRDFDVFLCYDPTDKAAVKQIALQLKERGLLPWFDEWELRPGLSWQRAVEEQIERIRYATVFIGRDDIGPWQRQEMEALLQAVIRRGCHVIPVLLSSVTKDPKLPLFLTNLTWVDFRTPDPDPLERLVQGITGERR